MQPADEEAYIEPTVVGVQLFPMQQEQAQLAALELEPLLELVDSDITMQEVDPEDKVFFPLLQAMHPTPVPSLSLPLELYVLRGHLATHTVAPRDEVLPMEQEVQPEPTPAPLLSRPLELKVFSGHGRAFLHTVVPGEEIC